MSKTSPVPERKVILVVDDEPLVRLNAVDIFEDLGFEVLEARDGLEALSVLESRPDVAVLFSDCRMPRMSGPELAREAAQRWPKLKIVLVTGYVSVDSVRDWPLLWKPYKAEDVERVVLSNESQAAARRRTLHG